MVETVALGEVEGWLVVGEDGVTDTEGAPVIEGGDPEVDGEDPEAEGEGLPEPG